jgi:hypothetical protein
MNENYVLWYPPFVTSLGFICPHGTRKLIICQREYIAMADNHFIEDAIDIAAYWPAEEISFKRIVHLQYWLTINELNDLKLPYKHLRDLKSCKEFVERVINSFQDIKLNNPEIYEYNIKHNIEIFGP